MTWRPSRDGAVALVAAAAVLSLFGLTLYALLISPPLLAVGDVTPEHVGQWVRVEGEVKTVARSPSGLLLILWDPLDGSELPAFARAGVYEAMRDAETLAPGAVVRVQGEVDVYVGALEIVIASPRGLAVLPA